MLMPNVHIAYTPRGAGLLCAMFYAEINGDVFGWWTGHRDGSYPAAFFKLENFYSVQDTGFFATDGSDLYGGWYYDYGSSRPVLDSPIPVNDDLCHELIRLQDAFVAEWLFYSSGSTVAGDEESAYGARDLPVQAVNVKSRKLNKLIQEDVIWRYSTHDFDPGVLDYLSRRWPLEYAKP